MEPPQLEPNRHDAIILYVLFTSATRWIPVPLADGIAANLLKRRLLEKLAESHGIQLERAAVKALADEEFYSFSGCLLAVLLFPIKFVFGKLMLLFRLKRLVDKISRHYHAARLAEYAIRTGLLAPGSSCNPAQLRTAIDAVCATSNVGPVEGAFRRTFKSQRGILNELATLFQNALRGWRGKRSENNVQTAIETVEAQTQTRAASIVAPFRMALDEIPAEHFQRLEAELAAALRSPGQSTITPRG